MLERHEMNHLLYTHCDAGAGDALINHWLISVRIHLDLSKFNILVIDFGLTQAQQAVLRAEGIELWPARADGRNSNIQYREIANYLERRNDIDQVIYSDCGDLVFQDDLCPLLDKDKESLRAVIEPGFNVALHGITLGFGDVRPECLSLIRSTIGDLPTANCGLLIGSREKFASIWATYQELCRGTSVHGTDQLIINYILRRDGFVELDRRWNYVTFINEQHFFYDTDGFMWNAQGRIRVLHNAGRYNLFRAIREFGYRQGRIRPKIYNNSIRLFYRAMNWLHGKLSRTEFKGRAAR